MKKPDFSKQAMSKFFLHHTEKLILGLCLLLFGVFFWMGWKKTPFDDASPTELAQMADKAESYIMADKWEAIKPYRVGSPTVLDDILKAEGEGKLKPSNYKIDLLSGIPAKTLDARQDPVVLPPTNLQGFTIKAPVMIAMTERFPDPYLELTPVSVPDAGGMGGGMGGGRPGGPGGFGGEEDDEEDMDDEDEYEDEGEDEGLGGLGGPGGGRGGLGGFGSDDEEEKDDEKKPTVDAGEQLTVVNAHTLPGVRSPAFGIPAGTTKPWLLDVVCITAVVDFQKQFQSYDSIFPGAIGYYPDRDKPLYQHVEVQRREVGSDQWVDRTEWIQFNLPKMYPTMHQMPKAFNSTAPDVTHPENWDPVLTGPIPPFALFDYRPFVSHPLLAGMQRTFPEPEKEEEVVLDAGTVFGNPKKDDEKDGGLGGGGLGGLGGGRGGGLGGGGLGGLGGGRGGGLGGLGGPGGGMGGGLGGLGGTRGDGALSPDAKQSRVGSDFTDYLKALDAKKPNSKHKLVRFFDVDPTSFEKPGASFEYRVRVWLGDPNNEDPMMEFVTAQGGAAKTGGFGGGMGPGMDDEEEYDEDEDEGEGDETVADDTTVFTKTPILSTMKVPAVRQRLNKATAEVDEKTKEMVYTIAEPRKKKVKNAEGVEETIVEYETIKIPPNRAYLRFARPSEWSEPTQVTFESDSSLVAAGKAIAPKTARMKIGGEDVEFPLTEPAAEMVASQWSGKYGTAIPSKQTVYRGDLMNYFTAAHIMNPITWRVYLTKNDSELAENEDKFRVPVRTQKMLVDSIGGGELPLPRTEKMRHDLASEFLVMDAAGNFKVHNDMEDRTTYRNLLLLPDENQTVGRGKKKKKKEEPSGFGRGGGGGLGGLGGFGDEDNR